MFEKIVDYGIFQISTISVVLNLLIYCTSERQLGLENKAPWKGWTRHSSCLLRLTVRELIMQKFGFAIKTRDGQMVESLFIAGQNQADAERKLRQMYLNCQVIRCSATPMDMRRGHQGVEVEDLLSMIAIECAVTR